MDSEKSQEMEDSDRFLYPKEDFDQTPSMADGVSARQELTYRQKLAMLMQTVGIKSGLSQLAVNTSVIYMHRFFMYRSVRKVPRIHIGVAFVFAAGKVEESARKLEFIIKTAVDTIRTNKNRDYMDKNDELTYRMDCEWKSRMETLMQNNCHIESPAYLEMRKIVLDYEIEIYSVMGFHLQVIHPHNYVIRMCAMLGAENIKDISQYAYNLATASSQLTMMCLKYKPDLIATVCLNIASIAHNVKFVSMKNETIHWFQVHNPTTEFAVVQSVTEEFMNVIKDCSLLPTWMASLAKNGRILNARPQGQPRGPGTVNSSVPGNRPNVLPQQRVPPSSSHPQTAHRNNSHPSSSHPNSSHPNSSHPNSSHPNSSHPNSSHPNLSNPASSHPATLHSAGDASSHSLPQPQVADLTDHTSAHSNGSQDRSQAPPGMRPPHQSRPHHRSQPPAPGVHQRSTSVPGAPPGHTARPPQQVRPNPQPVAPGQGRPSSTHPPAHPSSHQQRPRHPDHQRHPQSASRDPHRRPNYPQHDSSSHSSRRTSNLPPLAPDGRSPHTPAHSPPPSPPQVVQRPPSPPTATQLEPQLPVEEAKPQMPKLSLSAYRARVKPSEQTDSMLERPSTSSTPDALMAAGRPPANQPRTASPFSLPTSAEGAKLPGLKIKIRPPKSTPSPAGHSGPSSRSSTPHEEGEIVGTPPSKDGGLGIRIKLPVPSRSESHSSRTDSNGSGESSQREHKHRDKHRDREHKHKKSKKHREERHSSGHSSEHKHRDKHSSKRESSLESQHRSSKQPRTESSVSGYPAPPARQLQHQNSGFSINDAFTSTMPTNIFDCDSDEEEQSFHSQSHRGVTTAPPPPPPPHRSRESHGY